MYDGYSLKGEISSYIKVAIVFLVRVCVVRIRVAVYDNKRIDYSQNGSGMRKKDLF